MDDGQRQLPRSVRQQASAGKQVQRHSVYHWAGLHVRGQEEIARRIALGRARTTSSRPNYFVKNCKVVDFRFTLPANVRILKRRNFHSATRWEHTYLIARRQP